MSYWTIFLPANVYHGLFLPLLLESVFLCHSSKTLWSTNPVISPLPGIRLSKHILVSYGFHCMRLKHVTTLPRFGSVRFIQPSQWCWCGQLVWIIFRCSVALHAFMSLLTLLLILHSTALNIWCIPHKDQINTSYFCIIYFILHKNNDSHCVASACAGCLAFSKHPQVG